MNELEKEIPELEESVVLMPEAFPSVREILEQFEEQDDIEEKAHCLSIQDASGNEIGSVSYERENNIDLTGIIRGDGMNYILAYRDDNDLERITIEGMPVPLIQYAGENQKAKITYANGDAMEISYHRDNGIVDVIWTDCTGDMTEHYQYVSDEGGNLVCKVDMLRGKAYNYFHKNGNVIRVENENILFNAKGDITVKNLENAISYVYDSERKLIKTCIRDVEGNEQECCHTGVVRERRLQFAEDTALVESICFENGRRIAYEYDAMERVTKVTDSEEGVTVYTYDTLGQLVAETKNGVTTKFVYDSYGNITEKGADEVTSYTYGDPVWRDKLTAFNGETITYGEGGNPLFYRGYTFVWEKGRQLKFAVKNGKVISYSYDDRGIRTGKTVNGIPHTYLLKGRKILRETRGSTDVVYLYDSENRICGLQYKGKLYGFYKNLQGDIIAITDETGTVQATYTYDPWGNCSITSDTSGVGIAEVNPFRYKSYYYDAETGFYYLESRYYDPVTGRFLNADDPSILLDTVGEFLGVNLFTYCYNDPINRSDPTGRWGPSIHYGKEQSGQFRYGTVKWAMDCGMSKADAIVVATANNDVDEILTGAGFNPSRHFNKNEPGELDSRLNYFQKHYRKAIQLWRDSKCGSDGRKKALKELGKGLHSVQDYYAHLDYKYNNLFSTGHYSYSYDAYLARGTLEDRNTGYFDNEDYNIIEHSSGEYFHKYVGKKNSWRYNYTKQDTLNYIAGFMEHVCYNCCC